jgi:serine/threonine-protein kinase RsbT
MTSQRHEIVTVDSEQSVVSCRQIVKKWAVSVGFNMTEQTKIVTAVSELARNMFVHAGGGMMQVEEVIKGARRGLRVTFEDSGPGIPDVELAMRDGYTSGGGMGLGLGGSKRLVNEFEIMSEVGQGTRIVITSWK